MRRMATLAVFLALAALALAAPAPPPAAGAPAAAGAPLAPAPTVRPTAPPAAALPQAAPPQAAPAPAAPARAVGQRPMTVRLKDIAHIQGARDNQLVGYGIVVGLNGTGDTSDVISDIIKNFLERMGLTINADDLEAKNVAIASVTATLPAFARPGSRVDCLVSSLGDAKSLQGGVLLQTALLGADQRVYAVAQGPVSIGGFAAGGAAASIQKGHPTVAHIPNGALIERQVPVTLTRQNALTVCLREPDFTTAARMARAINERFPAAARPVDGGTVRVTVPPALRGQDRLVDFIADLEAVTVSPDAPARVIINERTGTIVSGAHVRIAQVAIAHGSLVFITKESAVVSQPAPLSRGQTTVVPDTGLEVREPQPHFAVIDEALTVGDVARALNALGVKPNDIVAIFQAIKRAGALSAELVIM